MFFSKNFLTFVAAPASAEKSVGQIAEKVQILGQAERAPGDGLGA